MELLIATVLVSAAISIYLTASISRRSIARSRKPTFWPMPFTALCGPVVIYFGGQGRDLFTSRFWNDFKAHLFPYFVFFLCVGTLLNIGPAAVTIILNRRKARIDQNETPKI